MNKDDLNHSKSANPANAPDDQGNESPDVHRGVTPDPFSAVAAGDTTPTADAPLPDPGLVVHDEFGSRSLPRQITVDRWRYADMLACLAARGIEVRIRAPLSTCHKDLTDRFVRSGTAKPDCEGMENLAPKRPEAPTHPDAGSQGPDAASTEIARAIALLASRTAPSSGVDVEALTAYLLQLLCDMQRRSGTHASHHVQAETCKVDLDKGQALTLSLAAKRMPRSGKRSKRSDCAADMDARFADLVRTPIGVLSAVIRGVVQRSVEDAKRKSRTLPTE